jgi:hypothetical protein
MSHVIRWCGFYLVIEIGDEPGADALGAPTTSRYGLIPSFHPPLRQLDVSTRRNLSRANRECGNCLEYREGESFWPHKSCVAEMLMSSLLADYREKYSRQPGDLQETHGFAPRPRSRFAQSEKRSRSNNAAREARVLARETNMSCEQLVAGSTAESIRCY